MSALVLGEDCLYDSITTEDNPIMQDQGPTAFLIALAVYFAPAIVAQVRNHKSAAAIAVLNILLCWTLLGWIVALVWAFTRNTNQKTVIGSGWNRRVVDENALRVKVLEAQLRELQPQTLAYAPPEPVEQAKSDPAYWDALDKLRSSALTRERERLSGGY